MAMRLSPTEAEVFKRLHQFEFFQDSEMEPGSGAWDYSIVHMITKQWPWTPTKANELLEQFVSLGLLEPTTLDDDETWMSLTQEGFDTWQAYQEKPDEVDDTSEKRVLLLTLAAAFMEGAEAIQAHRAGGPVFHNPYLTQLKELDS